MVRLEELLTREATAWNQFMNEKIVFDKYWMSVQCSYMHYCRPRVNTFLSDYTHFEVMMEVPKELITEEWEQYSDGGGVYGFVPKALVEELYIKLKQYVGL